MGCRTQAESSKVDLVNPKNDFQKDISNQFSGFDDINCVMLKQPFGIISWASFFLFLCIFNYF